MKVYRVSLSNGKTGYGVTSWEALVNAAGSIKKANLIAEQISRTSNVTGEIIAKNGVSIGYQESR